MKTKEFIVRLYVCSVCAVLVLPYASCIAETDDPATKPLTNLLALQYASSLTVLFETPSDDWWEKFTRDYLKRQSEVGYDRFGSVDLKLWQLRNVSVSAFQEAMKGQSRGVLETAGTYAGRETALEFPITYALTDWLERRQDVLAHLFRGSVGNVEEGQVNASDPAYNEMARSWFQQLRDGGLQYGIRPFSKYAFFAFRVGPKNDAPLLVNIRYYPDISRQRFQSSLNWSPWDGYFLDAGVTTRFVDNRRWVSVANLRLSKALSHKGYVFVALGGGEGFGFETGFQHVW